MRRAILLTILIATQFMPLSWARTRRVRPRAIRMEATAFAQQAKPTSSGTIAHDGIVAADPAVLPLGSRIRVSGAGVYSGVYTVTDTGSKIVGRHIDLFMPSAAEAKQFGKKIVVVRVLERGTGKEEARAIDIPARPSQ